MRAEAKMRVKHAFPQVVSFRRRIEASRRGAQFQLRVLRGEVVWPGYGLPFNGQRNRLRAIQQLIAAYDPDVFLETGTFRGDTTRFFLGYGKPVWTVEVKHSFYLAARLRLGFDSRLKMFRGDSPDIVRRLESEQFHRPFFYLDAHWWSVLPLVEELRLIDAGWDDALIVIDDCQVPGDAGYTYDVRSGVISGVASSDGGVTLAAENLPIATGALVGYPAEPSESETGARRGTLYIAQGERARAALRSTDSIRTGRRDG